jgi:colanic acid biosynthesis glycosyl transferase WcaI
MKIALISQYFYPETFSNNEIAKYLVSQGHVVDVICCVPNYPAGVFFNGYSNQVKRREVWEGVNIYRVRTVPRGDKNWQLLLNYLVYPFAAVWTFLTRARTPYDVSLVSMPSPLSQAFAGVYLKYVRGVPLAFWVQDIWPESAVYTLGLKSKFLTRPLSWICGWLYRRADLILVQSEAFPDMITRFRVPLNRISFFPNTAPESYQPLPRGNPPEPIEKLPSDKFRVMFAGNIGESQDFDTILDAVKIVKNYKNIQFLIVGSGRDLERVQRRVEQEGLEDCVFFLGRHPEEEMPNYFAQSDVMLVSLKDNPIFSLTVPYKIQCYLASGKPIIASLKGEGARILNLANAGISVNPEKPQDLSDAILMLANMPKHKLTALGVNGRSYFNTVYNKALVFGNLERNLKYISR